MVVMKMGLIELRMKEREKRYAHKPVNLLNEVRGILLWWWTNWYLSTNYSPLFLVLTTPKSNFFSF